MPPRRFRLKSNAGTEAPSNLLFFDSETHPPEKVGRNGQKALRLRLWCAIAIRLEGDRITRRVCARGTTADEFWSFLGSRCNPRNPLWAWCHNAAADWTWLDVWRELLSRRLTLGPIPRPPAADTGRPRAPWRGRMVLEARPTFMVARRGSSTLKLVDTGNFWPEKLAAIGARFGLDKGKVDFTSVDDETLYTYCLRDCEIIERAVVELLTWWRKENCGVFQMSAPALALQNYRHTAKAKTADGSAVDIIFEPNHPTHKLERRGYYGPRFEAFYEGELRGPVYKYDRNSCYLAEMEDRPFPRMRVGTPPGMTPAELRRQMTVYGAVAEVLIRSMHDGYPWKPKKHPMQLQPTGTFWTVLCGPELLRALDAGHVHQVGKAVLYSMSHIFRGWARTWHDRKVAAAAAGDAGHQEFCKLIGNSLSGKWGQHGTGWRDRLDMGYEPYNRKWVGVDPKTRDSGVFRGVAGVIQQFVSGDEPGHCSPIISAYISAYAREHMRWVMGKLPERSCYYIGSDALVLNADGAGTLHDLGLVSPTELGLFKQDVHGDGGEIVGTLCYRIGQRWTRSGVHGKPQVDKDGKLKSYRWEHMPAVVSRPFDGTVRYQELDWQDPEPRRKGRRGEDGWLTPFRLSLDGDYSDFPGEEQFADDQAPALA